MGNRGWQDFSATLDPSGILKAKILNQMKTREMDEKIRPFFTDKANVAIATAASAGSGASTATAATSATANSSDNECP